MRAIPFVCTQDFPHIPIILGLITILPTSTIASTLADVIAPIYKESMSSDKAITAPQRETTQINKEEHNTENDFVFDSAFFRGSNINQTTLLRLSEGGEISAGDYKVDIFINNQFIEKANIKFIETDHNKVQPCFKLAQLERASILVKSSDSLDTCQTLEQAIGSGSTQFNVSRLRLDLSIPQSLIKQTPRGYVPPSQLDDGETIGFINYYANYFYSNYENYGKNFKQDSTYLSLNGGINFGKWQFRQQSSLTNNNQGTEWNNIRSYFKRPIPSIQSELRAGQLTSSGRFFSGLSFNGINLSTDDRMLPDSVRGYAPIVQGIAKTTAKVTILQNGRELYQTTVAPGPFKIADLYPTSYNGDIDVVVMESDGSKSEFRVPFSAVPESVRQGAFKYNFDIGRTRDIGEDTNFTNITTQYGLNNQITLNNGFRFAQDYQAIMMGTAYTNFIGAFGAEVTYSRTKFENDNTLQGWMFGANYSKTFQATNTTVALAGYRFSTEGYRDLSDVIALRKSIKDGTPFQSATYQECSRATLTLNQSLNQFGTLFISGSASQYRDEKSNDLQLQVGYGKTLSNGITLNFTLSRQKIAYQYSNEYYPNKNYTQFNQQSNTTLGLSVNFPLQKTKSIRDLTLNYTQSDAEKNYQATIHGDIEKIKDLSYNIGINYDDQTNINVWTGGLNKRFDYLNTSVYVSKGNNYWQGSANAQGALAIHSGGITFGPYLSDTFALIKAKGAQGASVLNAQGTKINRFGYALIPALTPYRYNTIALNPEGMSAHTELASGDTKIAPYAGSSVKINFDTYQGYPVLVHGVFEDGSNIPFGSEVFNEDGENIGLAGQNGQIYFRANKHQGKIQVTLSTDENDQCLIHYTIPQSQLDVPLIRLNETCKVEKQ